MGDGQTSIGMGDFNRQFSPRSQGRAHVTSILISMSSDSAFFACVCSLSLMAMLQHFNFNCNFEPVTTTFNLACHRCIGEYWKRQSIAEAFPAETEISGGGSRKEDKASDSICHPSDCRQQPVEIKKILTGKRARKRLEGREGGRSNLPIIPLSRSLLSPSRADVSFVIGNYADGGGSSHSPPRSPNNGFSRSLSTK